MPSDKRARQREGRQQRQEAIRAAERRKRTRSMAVRFAALAAIGLVIVFLVTRSQGDDEDVATSSSTTAAVDDSSSTTAAESEAVKFGKTECPKADGSSPKTGTFAEPFKKCIDEAKTYKAKVVTDVGEFEITFDAKKAPATVNNFVSLARFHFYDGIVFHRVLKGFMAQGGDPTGTGSGGPGYQFGDELPKAGEYEIGSIAMANSGADTQGSQFFIITGAQGVSLPPSYSLFGKVTAGMDVVKKIEADGADADPAPPAVKHSITTVTITEEG